MIGMIVACASQHNMGTLVVNTPQKFSLMEDSDPVWRVQVTPNTTYIIKVDSELMDRAKRSQMN